MRKFCVLFSVLLFVFMPSWLQAQQAGDGWVISLTDAFTIQFPGEPKLTEEKEPHCITRVWGHVVQGQQVFIAGCTDYDSPVEPEEELIASRDNFLKGVEAKLVTSNRLEFTRAPSGPLPALEFTGETPDSNFKGVCVVYRQRSYLAVVGGRGNLLAAAEKFLGSFRILAW